MSERITVLTGGVGGAKLVRGLSRIMPPEALTAIINTGDDFTHLGLPICPDIDTLLYTLSGKANVKQGWGRAGESWAFMEAVRSLGGPGWFNLGDGDLALHVMRLAGVAEGLSKSELTARFAKSWGVGGAMLPMSDDPVATMLETDAGILDFQSYFVRERCAPKVSCIWFAGADSAAPAPHVIQAIQTADLILIAPSNPWLSIDPILAVPGIGQALRDAPAPVVAISPLIGGKAVKGPTAKIMAELGLALANDSIAEHYGDVLDGLLIDSADSPLSGDLPWAQTQTLMTNDIDRERVAHAALEFGRKLRK